MVYSFRFPCSHINAKSDPQSRLKYCTFKQVLHVDTNPWPVLNEYNQACIKQARGVVKFNMPIFPSVKPQTLCYTLPLSKYICSPWVTILWNNKGFCVCRPCPLYPRVGRFDQADAVRLAMFPCQGGWLCQLQRHGKAAVVCGSRAWAHYQCVALAGR